MHAQLTYGAEGVTNQAYWLGQWEIVDSVNRTVSLADEIDAITPEDIQRVSQQYLRPDRSTTGWLIPTAPTGSASTAPGPVQWAPYAPLAWSIHGGEANSYQFRRAELSNGIVVVGQDRPHSRSVALRLRVPAGSLLETDDDAGLAHLTARSMARVFPAGRSFDEISTLTDDLGSSLSIDAGRQFVEALPQPA